jgi:DNA-binding NarL/FixJ family response regulator
MNRISVLICDDHPVVRAGLRALLSAAEDIKVVGEAENGQQAVLKAKKFQPDVVLLDFAMPVMNGVEAARQIATEVPSARVLMLSVYSDQVQQALDAGATGYLSKETAGGDLLRAIRKTREGIPFFSPGISRALKPSKEAAPERPPCKITVPILTDRQAQVLQMIANGYLTREIATSLRISRKTAEKHRQSLMDKLDIHEIASLTRYAVSSGVVASNRPPAVPIAA